MRTESNPPTKCSSVSYTQRRAVSFQLFVPPQSMMALVTVSESFSGWESGTRGISGAGQHSGRDVGVKTRAAVPGGTDTEMVLEARGLPRKEAWARKAGTPYREAKAPEVSAQRPREPPVYHHQAGWDQAVSVNWMEPVSGVCLRSHEAGAWTKDRLARHLPWGSYACQLRPP